LLGSKNIGGHFPPLPPTQVTTMVSSKKALREVEKEVFGQHEAM